MPALLPDSPQLHSAHRKLGPDGRSGQVLLKRENDATLPCQDSARNDAATIDYAKWLTEHEAQARTAPLLPPRLLIFDSRIVMMPLNISLAAGGLTEDSFRFVHVLPCPAGGTRRPWRRRATVALCALPSAPSAQHPRPLSNSCRAVSPHWNREFLCADFWGSSLVFRAPVGFWLTCLPARCKAHFGPAEAVV